MNEGLKDRIDMTITIYNDKFNKIDRKFEVLNNEFGLQLLVIW